MCTSVATEFTLNKRIEKAVGKNLSFMSFLIFATSVFFSWDNFHKLAISGSNLNTARCTRAWLRECSSFTITYCTTSLPQTTKIFHIIFWLYSITLNPEPIKCSKKRKTLEVFHSYKLAEQNFWNFINVIKCYCTIFAQHVYCGNQFIWFVIITFHTIPNNLKFYM